MHISRGVVGRRVAGVLVAVTSVVVTALGGIVPASPAAAAGVAAAIPPGGSFVPYGPFRLFDSRSYGHPPTTDYSPFLQWRTGLEATALVLSVTVIADQSGWIRVGGDNWSGAGTSDGNFVGGEVTTFQAVATTGVGNRQTAFELSVPGDLVVDVEGYVTTPEAATTRFTAVPPRRLADSRMFSGLTTFGPDSSQRLVVAGRGGLPSELTAVLANVTVAGATASTFVTAWDGSTTRPQVSQVSAPAGGVRSSRVLLPVAADGSVSLYNAFGLTDLVVDVVGVVSDAPGGSYFQPADHVRLLDESVSSTVFVDPTLDGPAQDALVAPTVDDLVPTTAVWTTLTVDQPAADGFIRAYASGGGVPPTSDVNAVRGRAVANAAVVALGTGGSFQVATSTPARIVVDLVGWFRAVPDGPTPAGVYSSSTAPLQFSPASPREYVSTVATGLPAAFGAAVVNADREAPGATAWALGVDGAVSTSSTSGVDSDGGHLGRWSPATVPTWAAALPPMRVLGGAGDTRGAAVYGVDASGVVRGWGSNVAGELAAAPSSVPSGPVTIGIPKQVARVFGAPGVGYAATRSGELWSWGRDDTGQLGSADPGGASAWIPRRVGGVSNVVLLAGTATTTLAVDRSGKMFLWGGPAVRNQDLPARRFTARGCTAVSDLDVEDQDIWALCGDGTVRLLVWGGNPVSQPEAAVGVTGAVQIGPGDYHGAYGPRVLLADGTVVRVGQGVFTAPRIPGLVGVTALGGSAATPFTVVTAR